MTRSPDPVSDWSPISHQSLGLWGTLSTYFFQIDLSSAQHPSLDRLDVMRCVDRGSYAVTWLLVRCGETGKWGKMEWLGRAPGGRVCIGPSGLPLHSARPHTVIRLLVPLSSDKGESAAKPLAMKLGHLSRFLWD